MKTTIKILFFLSLFVLPKFAFATGEDLPDKIDVYVNVLDVWDMDLKEGTCQIDFILLLENPQGYFPIVDLFSGGINRIDTLDQGKFWITLRIKAEVHVNFNYARFPLDNQVIQLQLESRQDKTHFDFYANDGQNTIADSIHLEGWKIKGISSISKNFPFKEHEASGEIKTYNFSRMIIEIPIEREGKWMFFLKMMLPTIVSVILIIIGFILPNDQIEPRLNISLGSLFIIVSNLIITQDTLPALCIVTLIEKFNYISLFYIVIIIGIFAFSYVHRNDDARKRKYERWGGRTITLVYLILSAIILF